MESGLISPIILTTFSLSLGGCSGFWLLLTLLPRGLTKPLSIIRQVKYAPERVDLRHTQHFNYVRQTNHQAQTTGHIQTPGIPLGKQGPVRFILSSWEAQSLDRTQNKQDWTWGCFGVPTPIRGWIGAKKFLEKHSIPQTWVRSERLRSRPRG